MKDTMKVYIFFREEGFYPVEYINDQEAIKGAELNTGTLRVEDMDGVLIWRLKDD